MLNQSNKDIKNYVECNNNNNNNSNNNKGSDINKAWFSNIVYVALQGQILKHGNLFSSIIYSMIRQYDIVDFISSWYT